MANINSNDVFWRVLINDRHSKNKTQLNKDAYDELRERFRFEHHSRYHFELIYHALSYIVLFGFLYYNKHSPLFAILALLLATIPAIGSSLQVLIISFRVVFVLVLVWIVLITNYQLFV